MRPSPSITRRWAGPAALGGAAQGTRGRGGGTGVPAPNAWRAHHAQTWKERWRETVYFTAGEGGRAGGAGAPGAKAATEPGALLPIPPHPIPPALASHLGKVKISRKRLQIGLTPPLPLNKVYYRPGSNPFKSPTRGDGPGLGEGSVIPMNLLQGDLDSAGRADGPGPGSGKQPFSLMIPNKDKRAERIGDRRRGPAPWKGWSPGMLPCLPAPTTGTGGTELQLHSS